MPLFHLNRTKLTDDIHQKALQLGFSQCGFSKADPIDKKEISYVEKWLSKGKHATMHWLEHNKEKRYNPQKLSEDAKTIISLTFNYFPNTIIDKKNNYVISKYAYGKDYHYIMKKKLRLLLQFIEEKTGKRKAAIFVDSAPVLERYWAHKSGLGFIGKNTCLISKKKGSFFFIGNILIDIELEYNNYITNDFCGSCTRCIDACPTNALKPFELDANRCISYITIEYRGKQIPEYFKDKISNNIFGCDICQDICPWNRYATTHNEPAFEPSEKILSIQKTDWETLDKPHYKQLFKHTPIERAGFKQLKRNIEFLK